MFHACSCQTDGFFPLYFQRFQLTLISEPMSSTLFSTHPVNFYFGSSIIAFFFSSFLAINNHHSVNLYHSHYFYLLFLYEHEIVQSGLFFRQVNYNSYLDLPNQFCIVLFDTFNITHPHPKLSLKLPTTTLAKLFIKLDSTDKYTLR